MRFRGAPPKSSVLQTVKQSITNTLIFWFINIKEEKKMNENTNTNQTAEQAAEQTAEQTTEQSFTLTAQNDPTFDITEAHGTDIRYTTNTSTTVLFNAVNGSSEKISGILGNVVEVSDIVITSADVAEDFAERENKDAHRISKPCVHFFTTNGKHYASVSNGIVRSTKNLLMCGLTPTKETPIKLVFSEIQTKNGKAHTFDLVD